MVKEKKSVGNKAKQVVNRAKDKNREALNRAFQARRPVARLAIAELRSAYPHLNPQAALNIIEDELRNVEIKEGTTSQAFSDAATLYVFVNLEIHQIDPSTQTNFQKMADLAVILDSAAIKVARKAFVAAATIAMLLPQGKLAKGAKVVATAAVTTAAAKTFLQKVSPKVVLSNRIISKTNDLLGPAPEQWPDKNVEKPRWRWFRFFKR